MLMRRVEGSGNRSLLRSLLLCGGSAMLVALAPLPARAAASARLVYLRGPGAEQCPAEDAVRAAVRARLGYDPFFTWARDTLFLEITGSGHAFRTVIKLVADDNRQRGARDIAV